MLADSFGIVRTQNDRFVVSRQVISCWRGGGEVGVQGDGYAVQLRSEQG